MIIKSLSRKSNPAQLIRYVLRYSLKETKQARQEHATLMLRHNIRSRSLDGYIKEFLENESFRIYRRKDSVILYHTILSFSPLEKEKITPAILKDITQKFVELRAKNCLCLGVAHTEKDHPHVHVVVSGVATDGRSSRVSKEEFAHIIHSLETYQGETYPNLIHSQNEHEAKQEKLNHYKNSRQTIKSTLMQQLETIYSQSSSKETFINNLQAEHHELYYRNNNPQGIVLKGIKFRLSKLGFDDTRLQTLSKEYTHQNNMYALTKIRESKKQEQQKVTEEKKVFLTHQSDIDVLTKLRTEARERENETREVSIGPQNIPSNFNLAYEPTIVE